VPLPGKQTNKQVVKASDQAEKRTSSFLPGPA
jgi:hypothetical protein